MHIFITGGTGFIGSHLVPRLLDAGHRVTVLTRAPERAHARLGNGPAYFAADLDPERLARKLDGCEAIVNLAGEPVMGRRWSRARKNRLVDSRIGVTDRLVDGIRKCATPPTVFVSGSAVGFYGNRGDEILDETSAPGNDFLARLCVDWEQAAVQAEALGLRVPRIRTGIVLGRDGGALKRMLPLFRLGLGGKFGSGRQFLSWIHVEDLVDVLTAAVGDDRYRGPVNATAPQPVTNATFTRVLGSTLHRPAHLPVPAPALKLALGEAALMLLGGQRVLPAILKQHGFAHRFETVESCLANLLE